ncbi:unnamed protein product [Cercopithifilaria johnstoni]|uniref:Nanos-type domain-containing protein n=1 Tax=Cercopithifilaria johnstoni TaxID=2874296 RepID=A0A8J2M2N0_9BILA|nr:unnamed protein product [Cercopithifilaria johnstoni]
MSDMDNENRSKPEESNQNEENSHQRNRPEALPKLKHNLNEEYKPFDNGYNSPLSSPIIKEKIESVLHFASTPLVEDGTPESLLYQSWHTPSVNPMLPEDFFSVKHIQRRERELYNPRNHLLQNLVDLVESAVPSRPRQMSSEGQSTVTEANLLTSVDHQAGLQQSVTIPNDNFGNNFRSSSFSPQPFLQYMPIASGHSISNRPTQFDSFTPNLNSSLFGTPPVTPTSHLFAPNLSLSLFGTSLVTSTSHLSPGNLQPDLRSVKLSSSNESCGYCIATCEFPQDHNKKECPKLACMKPCKICNANGRENHTLIESPILGVINSRGTPRLVIFPHHFREVVPCNPPLHDVTEIQGLVAIPAIRCANSGERDRLIGRFELVTVEMPSECGTSTREGITMGLDEPDDYMRYKKLEKQLEHLDVMEEYVKLETRNLEKELLHAQEEVKRIQSVPLVIGQFLEAVDQDHAIVGSTTGSNYFVRVLSILDRELLKPGCSVALHKYSNALVDVLPPEADSTIQMLRADEKPDVSYTDIGGLDMQKQEVREAVELPLTHGELYQQIGIDPPRGVLMYGPPGCGKTMLAKAVAAHTTASFIRVVGSEFVQKYLGEGPRMVRDVFRLAKENSPSIIFIDEIDAIATKRFDAQTGADREVQRILLELLNQMDGFDQSTNVKVIMATNRQDTLDPALLRPGRLDRKIEFPMPDRRQKRLIFSTITAKMNLSDEVDMEDFVARPDKVSGADINAICQEAGMHAVRENRYVVLTKDFDKAYKSVIKKDQNDFEFYK